MKVEVTERICLRNKWQIGPYKQRALPHSFHWSWLHQWLSSTNSQVMADWLDDATVGSQTGTPNSKNSYVIYMIRLASEEIKKILKPWELGKSVLEQNSKESVCSETFINSFFFGQNYCQLIYIKLPSKGLLPVEKTERRLCFILLSSYYYKDE